MKKLLICIFFLFILSSLSYAQEIKVLEVKPLEHSLKARTAQVRDNNGELCALLEVAAPKLEGLAFDEVRHVGDVKYADGVYSLFVPAGTKTIGFKHRDYMPGTIDFGAFGVTVESGMVYSVGLQRTDVAQEYQFLVISVWPSSAFVEVDGQPQNVTNGIAQMLLPVGTVHHYKVSGNGMQTEEGDVVVRSADEKTTVNVALRSYSTKIHISSLEQASIRINGTVMGIGEWTGELTPGTYRIEAVLDGVVISNEVHEISMSDTVQDIVLEVKYGTATITSSVPNASVSVDGEPKGFTPLRLTRMTPGRHTIAISLDGYKEYTESFVVEPSSNVNVTASLEMLPQPKANVQPAPAEKPVQQPAAPKAPVVKEPKAKPVKAQPQSMVLVLADAGYAPGSGELSYGGMAGWAKGFGGYVRYRSSFSGVATQYSVGGGQSDVWLDGTVRTSRTLFCAGGLIRVSNAFYPYVGAGYGSRNAYGRVSRADGAEGWAELSDYTYSGVAVEAGVVLRLGKFALSLGANCTAFKYTDVDLGIGIAF